MKLGPTHSSEDSAKLPISSGSKGAVGACSESSCDRNEEKELTLRLQRGDDTAMCELIERYGEVLGQLVGRLTGWHADREDILQDVLLAIWNQAGSYRGEGSLEGWLKRIAVNRCRNHFRATQSIKRLIERFTLLRQPSERQSTNENDGQDEKLTSSLQKLSQADRTVLVLFYLEEMPGEEVAETLNIKLETLHVRLHRARSRLKKLIEATTT